MNRRSFVVGSLVTVAAPLAAEAQQARKPPRVGYLADGTAEDGPSRRLIEAGLREHGYVVGTDFVFEGRSAGGRPERLADLAAELVRVQPDIILAISERGAVAARRATAAIPIVMILGVDPVRRGLIESLARPGGNVTGLTVDAGSEIIAKRLQILRELVPSARTVALLTEPAPRELQQQRYKFIDEAAQTWGVSVTNVEVGQSHDLASAFTTTIRKIRADAILVSGDAMLYLSRHEVSALAFKHKVPSIYPLRDYVEAGGLISYGVVLSDLFRRAGGYVAKILNGAKPADLPVEQPTKFELVINLKTAKALGATIPPSLLLRADQVIE
jgi:putative ABC transport system substrate-binding protein